MVLPLLAETVVAPGWLTMDEFLAGYGAAQAIPGPLFSLAAFLGGRLSGDMGGMVGATLALAAIFLPGFLLLAGVLPFWQGLTRHPAAASAVAGVNAAVVGLLAAALYLPLWTGAVRGPADVMIALTAFVLLMVSRWSTLVAIAWCVAAKMLATILF